MPIGNADYKGVETEIRSVIQVQLDAFASGDATAAYGQASPTIQNLFPSELIFMEMVRSGYSVLIAPKRVDFLNLFEDDGSPVYRVGIESKDGTQWIAFYRMALQPDASWKIAGCIIFALSGQSV